MYIALFLTFFLCSLYGYFRIRGRKKVIKNIRWKYFLWMVSCVLFIVLALDFPFFVAMEKEIDINLNNVRVVSTGEGYKSIDLITLYKDDSGKVYWSGAPIGQRRWIEFGDRYSINRICRVKYLPISRIVVTAYQGNEVVYNNLKDILTFAVAGCFIFVILIISYTKESVFGVNKSSKW